MPHLLKRHPDSRSTEVHSITVNAMRAGKPGALLVSYVVEGALAGIALPPKLFQERADELWRHTCFEIFLKAPVLGASGGEPYVELNFSPSMKWAAYSFRERRRGMQNIDIPRPAVDVDISERMEVMAVIDLTGVPELPGDQPWRCNITTIIEQTNGVMSYWALAHAPGKADFHHPDGFVLDLPVPELKRPEQT
jgi:hypothetical protein